MFWREVHTVGSGPIASLFTVKAPTGRGVACSEVSQQHSRGISASALTGNVPQASGRFFVDYRQTPKDSTKHGNAGSFAHFLYCIP
jgi:hypothetical protein